MCHMSFETAAPALETDQTAVDPHLNGRRSVARSVPNGGDASDSAVWSVLAGFAGE